MASLAEMIAAKAKAVAVPVVVDKNMAELDKAVAYEKSVTGNSDVKSLDDMLDAPIGSVNKTILRDAEIATADIVPRIRQLSALSDIQTETEMKLLKAALMANPQAVSLMLPEDVGLLVVALRRITNEAIVAEASKKTTKTKTKDTDIDFKKLSAADLASVEDF